MFAEEGWGGEGGWKGRGGGGEGRGVDIPRFSWQEEEQGWAVGRYGRPAELAYDRVARPGLKGESRRT